MAVFAIKSAGRAVLRRSQFQAHRQQPTSFTPKRHSSSTTPKASDNAANGTAIPIPATVATLPLWQRLGPLTRTFQAYGRAQRKRPYTTQFCSSLVIYFLGDLSAQSINGDDYDWKRTVRALFISMGSSIPSYKWFMFLSNNFNYSSKIASLATKVTINQITFTPIFNTYFFGMQSLLSGDSLADAWERVKRTVPISMMNSIKLWPAVTAISFAWIEPQYRSIFAGVIAIGWQTYLSFLNRTAETEIAVAHEHTVKRKEITAREERETSQQKVEA
ncbi:mpv17 pmp22 family protein [Rutstroemia sp. NJR-2017a BBW]|nr:mpv17 pmp22 family protein [Rutstroemia sp. NJR-2017a BBW]